VTKNYLFILLSIFLHSTRYHGVFKLRIWGPITKSSVADLDPNPDPHVFGLLDPDPDPLVRDMDPDPSIIKQKL
jgi:hypothetical protein